MNTDTKSGATRGSHVRKIANFMTLALIFAVVITAGSTLLNAFL